MDKEKQSAKSLFMKKIGRQGGLIGGHSRSPKKVKASQENGRKPCRPGKKRGRQPKSLTPYNG